jgi:two-component system catabolic regulation response regulator CreB
LSARILLVEDDPAIAGTIAFALGREGFEVEHVLLARAARESVARRLPDVALLDVGLPDGNGLDLCRDWRQGTTALRALPVMMLTARGEELDRVLGLELGADDYLAKPFSPRELVARVRALLRRAALAGPAAARADEALLFELDAEGQRVRFAGTWLALTRLELGLLAALLRAPGRIRSRDALLAEVWGADTEATDRTVDTHVKTLRAKLRAVRPDLEPVATHRGLGYSIATTPPPPRG